MKKMERKTTLIFVVLATLLPYLYFLSIGISVFIANFWLLFIFLIFVMYLYKKYFRQIKMINKDKKILMIHFLIPIALLIMFFAVVIINVSSHLYVYLIALFSFFLLTFSINLLHFQIKRHNFNYDSLYTLIILLLSILFSVFVYLFLIPMYGIFFILAIVILIINLAYYILKR